MNSLVELSWETGENPIVYVRSCAKPLQASLIEDYGLDFSDEEIALCCASHMGEKVHRELAARFLARLGLDKSLLLVPFEHNCVGKHIMMLELCRVNGWELGGYGEFEHPVQIAVKNKVCRLCGCADLPVVKDGCGVPTFEMTLQDLMRGFLNVPGRILDAMREFPYIIGGAGKLDTKIMSLPAGLVAKNGAGGLCVVANPSVGRAFAVKIADENPHTREVVAMEMIKDLGWL